MLQNTGADGGRAVMVVDDNIDFLNEIHRMLVSNDVRDVISRPTLNKKLVQMAEQS